MLVANKTKPELYDVFSMDSIPDEIWVDIFKHSFLWDSRNPVFIQPSHDYVYYQGSPFLPTYVCSNWRRINLEDHSLWSSLTISGGLPELAGKHAGKIWPNTQRIKLWFERSGPGRPLSIFFDLQALQNKEAEGNPHILSCLRLFISLSRRWRHVLLSGLGEYDDCAVPSLDEIQPAALLQYLNIQHGGPFGDSVFSVYPWILDITKNSPNLQMLFFSDFSAADVDAAFLTQLSPPQLAQLLHLRLNCIPPPDIVINILKLCTNLISCSITSVCHPETTQVNALLPSTLPHLRYLRLEAVVRYYPLDVLYLPRILDAITAPSLISLTLANDGGWNPVAFHRFLTRSQCTLQHLIFQNTIMSSITVLEFLEANPSLIVFRSGSPQYPDPSGNQRLLNALQDYDQSSKRCALVPLIEDIVLDSGHLRLACVDEKYPDSEAGSFIRAIGTRLAMNPAERRLRKVGFTSPPGWLSAIWLEEHHVRFEDVAREALHEICPDLIVPERPHIDDPEWLHARGWLMD